MANQTTLAYCDAAAEEIALYRADPATAAIIPAAGQIHLKLADILSAVSAGDTLSLGLLHYTDSVSGLTKCVLALLGTAQADSPPTAGGANSNIWLGGSGGGGGVIELTLQSVLGDYVAGAKTAPLAVTSITSSGTTATLTTTAPHGLAGTANVVIAGAAPNGYNGTFLATITGASTFTYPLASSLSSPATGAITCAPVIFAAKPWKLRHSRTTETGADGTVYSLSYNGGADASTTNNNVQRTKLGTSGPGSGLTELEAVAPEWLVGDIFYALPATTTLLDANSNPITLIIAGECRNWTAIPA
jgi:hypothetical protein